MIYYIKSFVSLATSIAFYFTALFVHIPVLSKFPLEYGALLFVGILLAWRPLYVNTGLFSDPANQTMTFGEAIRKQPLVAVANAAGLFGCVLIALVSIMVQSLQSLRVP